MELVYNTKHWNSSFSRKFSSVIAISWTVTSSLTSATESTQNRDGCWWLMPSILLQLESHFLALERAGPVKFHKIIISATDVALMLKHMVWLCTQSHKPGSSVTQILRKKAALTDFALKDGIVTCTCFKIFHLPKSVPHEHPIYFICPFFLNDLKESLLSSGNNLLLSVLVFRLGFTLCSPKDYSPPGFSVHGISR